MKYIVGIHNKEDLRIPNNRIFQLKKILHSNIENFIKHYSFDVMSECNEEDGPPSELESDDDVSIRDYDNDSSYYNTSMNGKVIILDDLDQTSQQQIEGEKGGTSDKCKGNYCESCGSYTEEIQIKVP